MPIVPKNKTLTSTSVEVLNVIRNNATQNYKDYVPVATADADSIREIGAIIMDYPTLQNEFLQALINRIGLVLVTSKTYDNPWSMFKKGMMEFGESVEEVFVNIANPQQYDIDVAESELFKKEIPDVKSAFHIVNYKKFYKATVSQNELRQAFLSWDGVTDLISKIIESMYTAANYDEFLVMKYMLARHILNGRLYPQDIADVDNVENMKSIITTIKGTSNTLEFMSDKYNVAGVKTHSKKEDQIVLINAKFDASMDVNVLASAFNMDKAQFMGQRVLVDSFGSLDIARLAILFEGDSTYVEPSQEELEALDKIPAVVVDRNYFMIFDNLLQMRDAENGQGLYWNYMLHVWKTFSVSPFANAIMFVPAESKVTSVEVTPGEVTLSAGASVQLSANVETTGFAPKTVTYTSDSDHATVTEKGLVTLDSEASGSIVITATSTYDSEVKGTCTITVA